jgi:hypothetical protein
MFFHTDLASTRLCFTGNAVLYWSCVKEDLVKKMHMSSLEVQPASPFIEYEGRVIQSSPLAFGSFTSYYAQVKEEYTSAPPFFGLKKLSDNSFSRTG